MQKFSGVCHAAFTGSLAVALIQGALGGLGFLIFGIASPLLWGASMALLSLVPVVGTALVWGPVVVLKGARSALAALRSTRVPVLMTSDLYDIVSPFAAFARDSPAARAIKYASLLPVSPEVPGSENDGIRAWVTPQLLHCTRRISIRAFKWYFR